MARHSFTALIKKEADLYVAECVEVLTVSQGSSIEEALYNLQEATNLYLEEIDAVELSRPVLTTFEAEINE